MTSRVSPDGSLSVGGGVIIPAEDLRVRVTTSGGPGGQHANRSLTKVVVVFDVMACTTLSDAQRRRLVRRLGERVTTSSGRHRSQGANREAALTAMAERLAEGLLPPTPRRRTGPTVASRRRRLDDKRARSDLKRQRRDID